MVLIVLLTLLIAAVIMWIGALVLAAEHGLIWKYLLIHSLAFCLYSFLWLSDYSKVITGHDEYGLRRFFGYLIILISHSVIGYIVLKLNLNRTRHKA